MRSETESHIWTIQLGGRRLQGSTGGVEKPIRIPLKDAPRDFLGSICTHPSKSQSGSMFGQRAWVFVAAKGWFCFFLFFVFFSKRPRPPVSGARALFLSLTVPSVPAKRSRHSQELGWGHHVVSVRLGQSLPLDKFPRLGGSFGEAERWMPLPCCKQTNQGKEMGMGQN